MKKFIIFLGVIVLSLITIHSWIFFDSFAKENTSNNLFEFVKQDKLGKKSKMILENIKKSSTTKDIALVYIKNHLLLSEKSLTFNLSPKRSFVVHREKVEKRGKNNISWYGNINGKKTYQMRLF